VAMMVRGSVVVDSSRPQWVLTLAEHWVGARRGDGFKSAARTGGAAMGSGTHEYAKMLIRTTGAAWHPGDQRAPH
jgi:hypothetical protein